MKHLIRVCVVLIVLSTFLYSADFKVGGVYTAWGQSQHDFTFGAKKYNDNYVVQMLRFKVQVAVNEHLRAVTRFDMAQGWWGVDNALKSKLRTGTAGGSSLFDFKDTNFLFHVDQAYIEFDIPEKPLTFRVGRMWYGVGNKIMVDNNYDGIQADLKGVLGKKITVSWAKVSEGVDGLSDEKSLPQDQRNFTDGRDAHLFSFNFNNKVSSLDYNVYGFYYNDASVADMNAYVPDHLQFFKTRFSPQVTQLTALGVSGTFKKGKIKADFEADYLKGKDDIKNTKHGENQNWDINDGNLAGYNLYLKLVHTTTDKLSLGGVFGMGSGDNDLRGGKGNVNKLRTSGFFYITEVWEDSIMPDEEGITPQGLGAPNVRGYRELENTTILQINAEYKPLKKLSAFVSYNYLRSTQPIHAWASDGADDWKIDPDTKSNDLGQEVDFRVSYKIYDELTFTLRGGYFVPGKAAGYLINGTDSYNDPAWELKSTLTLKF
ncbi:MAG: alginate export family protein [Calditrichaeota bacterium]|nr:alginate export family protein [Calditrichota bacterium]